MYDFIIHIALVVSLGVIIYLLARALPRVTDEHGTLPPGLFDRLVDRLPLQRIDIAISAFLERLLRKGKVLVSKMDNSINSYIERVRKHSPAVRMAREPDLKEKMEAMKEDMKNTH